MATRLVGGKKSGKTDYVRRRLRSWKGRICSIECVNGSSETERPRSTSLFGERRRHAGNRVTIGTDCDLRGQSGKLTFTRGVESNQLNSVELHLVQISSRSYEVKTNSPEKNSPIQLNQVRSVLFGAAAGAATVVVAVLGQAVTAAGTARVLLALATDGGTVGRPAGRSVPYHRLVVVRLRVHQDERQLRDEVTAGVWGGGGGREKEMN